MYEIKIQNIMSSHLHKQLLFRYTIFPLATSNLQKFWNLKKMGYRLVPQDAKTMENLWTTMNLQTCHPNTASLQQILHYCNYFFWIQLLLKSFFQHWVPNCLHSNDNVHRDSQSWREAKYFSNSLLVCFE